MKNDPLKAKTRQQIANELGVSPRTLRRWLRKHQIELSTGLVYPKDQRMIYEKLGNPENIDVFQAKETESVR